MSTKHSTHKMSNLHAGKLLESVIDNMLEGFQVISRDWRYLYVNETVARQGKRKKEDLIGRTMMECYPGIDKTPFFVNLKKSMSKRVSIKMENEFIYPDKSVAWFQLFMHPCDEGVLIFSIDITDRKKVEKKLYTKIEDINKMTTLMVGREVKMAELKKKLINLQNLIPMSTVSRKMESKEL